MSERRRGEHVGHALATAKPVVAVVTSLALLASTAHSARAQTVNEESARIAFTEGLHLRDREHDARRALEKLKAAHDLAVTARTSYELGKTYMMLGSLVEAERLFLEVTRLAPDPQQSEAAKEAREQSARLSVELESRIPSIAVRLSGGGATGAAVFIDGVRVPDAARSLPWKTNPGRHEVAVKVAGQPDVSRTVTLSEGKGETIDVDVPAPVATTHTTVSTSSAPTPGEQTSASTWSPLRIAAVGVGVAGVGAIVAGGVLGLAAKSSFDNARSTQCGAAIGAPSDSLCTAAGVAARQNAGTQADVATFVLSAGGAAVITGVVLWLVAPKHAGHATALAVGVAPRAVVVEGVF